MPDRARVGRPSGGRDDRYGQVIQRLKDWRQPKLPRSSQLPAPGRRTGLA